MNHGGSKSKILAKKKLRQPFYGKTLQQIECYSLEALKRCLDPKMDHEGQIWAKIAGER